MKVQFFGEAMMNRVDRPAERLLASWTVIGLLILRHQAKYVEVEVPFLAFDAAEVARALTASFDYIKQPGWDKRAIAAGVTEDELYALSQKRDHEIAVARCDLTLTAAIIAQRGSVIPATVSRERLEQYLYMRFIRGGRGVVEPGPVEFLFLADAAIPTIFATEPLADVTRFAGRDFLSIRVSQAELQEQVKNTLSNLEEGKPPEPSTLINIEDCFPNNTPEVDD